MIQLNIPSLEKHSTIFERKEIVCHHYLTQTMNHRDVSVFASSCDGIEIFLKNYFIYGLKATHNVERFVFYCKRISDCFYILVPRISSAYLQKGNVVVLTYSYPYKIDVSSLSVFFKNKSYV